MEDEDRYAMLERRFNKEQQRADDCQEELEKERRRAGELERELILVRKECEEYRTTVTVEGGIVELVKQATSCTSDAPDGKGRAGKGGDGCAGGGDVLDVRVLRDQNARMMCALEKSFQLHGAVHTHLEVCGGTHAAQSTSSRTMLVPGADGATETGEGEVAVHVRECERDARATWTAAAVGASGTLKADGAGRDAEVVVSTTRLDEAGEHDNRFAIVTAEVAAGRMGRGTLQDRPSSKTAGVLRVQTRVGIGNGSGGRGSTSFPEQVYSPHHSPIAAAEVQTCAEIRRALVPRNERWSPGQVFTPNTTRHMYRRRNQVADEPPTSLRDLTMAMAASVGSGRARIAY